VLTGWALYRRCNMFPVRFGLDVYISYYSHDLTTKPRPMFPFTEISVKDEGFINIEGKPSKILGSKTWP
jgi:hypothetical protein